MGFIDVDKLVRLCRSTQWTTYKIWQAVKAGDLSYKPVVYMRYETPLKDALKQMVSRNTKYAVIKRNSWEVGMIGEQRLRETLHNRSIDISQDEETKGGYLDTLHQKINSWRKSGSADLSKESGQYRTLLSSSNISNNRISKDKFGNELSRISRNAEAD